MSGEFQAITLESLEFYFRIVFTTDDYKQGM